MDSGAPARVGNLSLVRSRDAHLGLLLLAAGVGGLIGARSLAVGTLLTMGPGFMPVLIGSAAIFLGAVKMLEGLRQSGEPWSAVRLRPTFFTCAGILAFAYAVEPLGLPLAIVLLVLVSSLGSRETNWRHTTMLAVILAAGCVALFAYAL